MLYNNCIVVGSGDTVHKNGNFIDKFDAVFRMNDAPTTGFELFVGNKTTFRLINKLSVQTWLGIKKHTRYEHKNKDRFNPNLCFKPVKCIVTDTWKDYTRHVLQARKMYPQIDLKIDSAIRKKSERILKKIPVSQGFVSFIYARQMCKHTRIINFDPNCCKSNRNYKYYHTNITKFVCCSKGREPFELEYNFYNNILG